MIADSGERIEFDTGAVRDIKEGKGRCDLLPLNIIHRVISNKDHSRKGILGDLEVFQRTLDVNILFDIINSFIYDYYKGKSKVEVILDLSVHYEEGAKKYQPWNWTKGIPLWSFIDSAVRHYLKVLDGWTDESHTRAFLWNIIGAIWTVENKPNMVQKLKYSEGYVSVVEGQNERE